MPPPDGTGSGPDDGPDVTGPGAGQRGWVPPDDRLWRHPSEMWMPPGAAGPGAGEAPAERPRPAGPVRGHRRAATVLVGTGAAAAVAVGVLLLIGASTGTGPSRSGGGSQPSTALTVVRGCCKVVPSPQRGVRDAMVSLDVTTATGARQECGVVVAPGGLVATTLDAVDGAHAITAVTASGSRLPASLVATDKTSDVAVVRVPDNLPVARFAGDTWALTGHRAIVMAVATASASGTGAGTATMWTAGTIRSAGASVRRGGAAGMAGIEAATGTRPAMAGEVLLDHSGRVLGIYDRSGSAAGHTGHGQRASKMFLPAQLVVGVANALAVSGQVDHGWLDIQGSDAPSRSIDTTSTSTGGGHAGSNGTGGGAEVEAVDPFGASAGVLRPGEVIRTIDRHPVRTMAQLRDRLYVLRPGTRVELGVSEGGASWTVAVDLSASP